MIVTFFNYAKAKGFLIDLVRMPVKGNVIMNCTTINVVNVNVNDNYVDIEAELDSQNESMKAYIITNVEVKKKRRYFILGSMVDMVLARNLRNLQLTNNLMEKKSKKSY